jgi:hypothetical protein
MNEFIRQAGTVNEEGPVDQLYREGLELFWDHHYRNAIERFYDVTSLYPEHSETMRLIRDCRRALAEGKEK